MKRVYIKEKAYKSIEKGHPWVFSGAVDSTDSSIQDGELASLYFKDRFLGIGYYNSKTNISFRILTRDSLEINLDFFIKRFEILKREKEFFLNNTDAYRLCFGEADNIPGLVVDIYCKVIVIQFHTAGIERLKDFIVKALVDLYNPIAIYEKREIHSRKEEGLDNKSTLLLYGEEVDAVEIKENGFKFIIDIREGQKTGFFLDQRENRKLLTKFTNGKNVLNCFSYTGGFSVYAASNARAVTSVDISKKAIDLAKLNFKKNGIDLNNHSFFVKDVFDFLKDINIGDFDLIILDPPSFAKSRNQIKSAIKAYTTINTIALKKIKEYNILVTSSCTAHIDELTFLKILHQSSINSNCQLKVIASNLQPHDHPYNLSYPEGRYLKFFVLQKWPLL